MMRAIKKLLMSFNSKPVEGYSQLVTSVRSDELFNSIYDGDLEKFEMKPSQWRRDRFYNLYELFKASLGVPGDVVECGCWKGLSSSLMARTYREVVNRNYSGDGFHIFDSFMGLSEPNLKEKNKFGSARVSKGDFSASLELVRNNLSEFPQIKYYPGFIPQTLSLPDGINLRFVHVDLDLVDPTLAAVEYFMPRLNQGGILVCDDYGSHLWQETKKALDSFSKRSEAVMFRLSTGQCFFIKGYPNLI